MLRFFFSPLVIIPLLVCFPLARPGHSAGEATPAAGSASAHAQPSLDAMLGSMLMFGFRGTAPGQDDKFLKMLGDGSIGNVILFEKDMTSGGERNIRSPEQLRGLTKILRDAAQRPIFIAIDQEGGQVRRLKPQKGFMDLPSAQRLGQGSVEDTKVIAEELGRELHDLGINMDLAPVVDVDVNPFNPAIGKLGRAFNTDPALVAGHALAFGQGLAKNGVAPTLKHFPGQGCAQTDPHLEPADISQCWNAGVDLLPYADIIQKGWPGAIMVGHLLQKDLDADLPATLSKKIVTGLLRDALGWQGVVISDDLQMKAAMQDRDLKETIFLAVDAGMDILLFGNNLQWDADLPDKVVNAMRSLVQEGRLTEERIRQSWQRISSLRNLYASATTQ